MEPPDLGQHFLTDAGAIERLLAAARPEAGERALDIRKLRAETGYVTLDPGYANTGSCKSAITFIDGDSGILRYRGIPIEELAEKSTFLEVAWLLINGELPAGAELDGPCLIEPAVLCNHCGYCQSYGH